MTKILYIINNFEDNSLNRHVYNISTNLHKDKFIVYILALGTTGTLINYFTTVFAGKIFISNGSFLDGIFLTENIVKRFDINIIHTQTLRAEYTTFITKCLLPNYKNRITHLANRHNYFFLSCETDFLWKNILYLFSCHLADLNICVANHLSHKLISKLHVPTQKVITIFNGVKIKNRSDLNRKHTSSPPIIIYTGQLIKRKNVICLIEAFSKITLPYKCLIIGDGPERSRLARYVNEQKLENKISFIPFTTNINKYLSKADIFVLPSLSEGMSMSLLEAMSFGIACIVSDIDANKELIRNEKNGLIFSLKLGHTDLYSKLLLLSKSQKLRFRLGKKAFQDIGKKYAYGKSLGKYLAYYKDYLLPRI